MMQHQFMLNPNKLENALGLLLIGDIPLLQSIHKHACSVHAGELIGLLITKASPYIPSQPL